MSRTLIAALLVVLGLSACADVTAPRNDEGDFTVIESAPMKSVDLDDLEGIIDQLDDSDEDCETIKNGLLGWIAEQRAGLATRFVEDFGALGTTGWSGPHSGGHYPVDISIDSCVWWDDCEQLWSYDPPGPDGPFNPTAAYVIAHEGAHAFLHDHDDGSVHNSAMACMGPEV